MCPWKPEEDIGFSEAGVKGGWMLSGMGSKLMYKNSTSFQRLIHLSTTNLVYPKKKIGFRFQENLAYVLRAEQGLMDTKVADMVDMVPNIMKQVSR